MLYFQPQTVGIRSPPIIHELTGGNRPCQILLRQCLRGRRPRLPHVQDQACVGQKSQAARGGRFHLDPESKGVGVNVPGAFAEYRSLPAFHVLPLPDSINNDLGAILDPLGNAVLLLLCRSMWPEKTFSSRGSARSASWQPRERAMSSSPSLILRADIATKAGG